jgi:hypothetical protein
MNRKGVCYDVGRVLEGSLQRPNFDPRVVHRELEIIKNDLHCNAVRIQGLDIERLMVAAQDALKQGLEVCFSPEMFEKSQEETLDYLVKAATAAESLRERWPELIFSLGSELTLFMQGILEGNNLLERMNDPSFLETIKTGKHNQSLNAFLARANETVRDVFYGKVTYFSVPLESVNWSSFDFVGVDLYRDERIRDTYGQMVKSYLAHSKPVLIGEFGCCTYQGAEKLGGMGWAIMFGMLTEFLHLGIQSLPKTIAYVIKVPTQIDGHYVRDESLQALELAEQLSVLEAAGVDGTFLFTFVSPTSHYNEDPRFDSDMASYSLVKSYAEKENLREMIKVTAKQGKELLDVDIDPAQLEKFVGNAGKHGTTYPDMTWEPKESFRAVADYYSKH